MNTTSPLLLMGVGTAGCAMARGVSRAYGEGLRLLLVDTDATSGEDADDAFVLVGGDRLSGRGAGGDVVTARLAAEESIRALDTRLEGVRLAVIVTGLGGGTGGGVTLETARHLARLGIPAIVFATTPFAFEGDGALKNARGIMPMIEETASATFFIALDKLVLDEDNMGEALRRAVDTLAGGVTLFWRLVMKPGYLRLDAERLRHLLGGAGRGRFATVTTQGPERAAEAVNRLVRSDLLATASAPVRAILCGVLAGDDLHLSEVGQIAEGVRDAFGRRLAFELATVNDERTFSGRISVVIMLFEAGADRNGAPPKPGSEGRPARHPRAPLAFGPTGRGRFNNAEPTVWGEDNLDVPTFIRKNVTLEF